MKSSRTLDRAIASLAIFDEDEGMDETIPSEPAVCICDEHELCLVCLSPELVLLLQLKLSLPWARSPLELRERASAREFLAATAQNN